MKPESKNINDYLKYDIVVDWQNTAIQKKAEDIIKKDINDVSNARLIYEWVRDKIPHSNDIDSRVLTCTATDTLFHGTGMCYSKSHLLAALLRAVHIPTGFCYQVLRNDPPVDNKLVLHGLNGIYISEIKKWVIVDARGNTHDINAQFRIDTPQLAFSMDHSVGEFLYQTIFVSPFENVINKLKKYKSRKEFGADLPEPIEN